MCIIDPKQEKKKRSPFQTSILPVALILAFHSTTLGIVFDASMLSLPYCNRFDDRKAKKSFGAEVYTIDTVRTQMFIDSKHIKNINKNTCLNKMENVTSMSSHVIGRLSALFVLL